MQLLIREFLFLDAKSLLEQKNKEIIQNEEHLSIVEGERLKLMSELALQMQTKVRILVFI